MNENKPILKNKVPVLLSLGSNLGEKREYIKNAIELLKKSNALKNEYDLLCSIAHSMNPMLTTLFIGNNRYQ